MISARAGWYWRRLRAMSAEEVAYRAADQARRTVWARRQVRPGEVGTLPSVGAVDGRRRFAVPLPGGLAGEVPTPARDALVASASALLDGKWEVLGVERPDVADPDWFLDPLTGRRAPDDRYCFRVRFRSEEETGNVKQIWELSRHHHLTVLAAAWFLTGDERYASTVDRQLRDWWRRNPNLSGVHWTSGIEAGIRLISWVWIRRLLEGWAGAPALFEDNDSAVCQIGWHQQYLAAFRSRGTSANNHVVAEAAGQLTAACAFPWFRHSGRWRSSAAAVLEQELEHNTFPSGVNRELASDYHGLVTELGLLAAVEAGAAGHPLAEATWRRLGRMADVAAALVDERLRPPRQGDGDDGRTLVVDAEGDGGWGSVLAMASTVLGPCPWWPAAPADVRSTVVGALAGAAAPRATGRRPPARPSHFADAGLPLLRTPAGAEPEIWCRGDGGPHGFLGIAAHAHADALSVEVRHGGVDVLADPGTYCYHGEPAWRAYFRSTVAHNTLELGGRDQSASGGPFLWTTQARGTVLVSEVDDDAPVVSWSAEHDGYSTLAPPAVHRRKVTLDRPRRRLEILDTVAGAGRHPCRLAFTLGPAVAVRLEGTVATLTWAGAGHATMDLPAALSWAVHRGETDPVLGWYSPRFGVKEPTAVLLGSGWAPEGPDGSFRTVLGFH